MTGPFCPELTLPKAAADALRAALGPARVVLEYGAGGSTLLAAAEPGRQIFSVETDPDWIANLQAWIALNPTASPVMLHHADIGPVRKWGHPADLSAMDRWAAYPHSVWDRPDFQHPDLVLIDGRFRAATFAAVALRITRPTVVLFDDYEGRPAYHSVEQLAKPVAFHGRMARFELSPMSLPRGLAGWYAALVTKTL